MTEKEKMPNIKKIEYFPRERTILREDIQLGDCIGYFFDSTCTDLRIGIIESFIADTKSQKAIIVLTDGKHIPLNRVYHRLKSNQIELTK